MDEAAVILEEATSSGRIHAASIYVRQKDEAYSRSFGAAQTPDAMFLIASISKPMSVAALMTLYDQGEFKLDDPVKKFIPEFTGGGRDQMTVRHLLTHIAGLPDQLPENEALRKRHAGLSEFVAGAVRTPLLFEPGTRYSYSSMGILLAAEIAQRISETEYATFMDEAVFQPLAMRHSAAGLGRFQLEDMMRCQVEHAAPESGAGDPAATNWDWNSPYWRKLGAPWGGIHSSAGDVATFLNEFLHARGQMLRPETARLMLRNHNREGLSSRGLGFDVGTGVGGRGCSDSTFGHSGSTGTLAWADPDTDTICVVLTTLPGDAVEPHPRQLVSDAAAKGSRAQGEAAAEPQRRGKRKM